MNATPEQKQTIAEWVSEGCTLAEIQRRLNTQFSLVVPYMEARMLLIDLGLELKDQRASSTPAVLTKTDPDDLAGPAQPLPEEDEPTAYGTDDAAGELGADAADEAAAGGGNVRVEVDRLVRPGTVVSGSVTFSDGVTATWALDKMGRLGLDAGRKGYRPNTNDIRDFQLALQRELQKTGY